MRTKLGWLGGPRGYPFKTCDTAPALLAVPWKNSIWCCLESWNRLPDNARLDRFSAVWRLLPAECVKQHTAIDVLHSVQIGANEWPL
jgi:hypothetical protein